MRAGHFALPSRRGPNAGEEHAEAGVLIVEKRTVKPIEGPALLRGARAQNSGGFQFAVNEGRIEEIADADSEG